MLLMSIKHLNTLVFYKIISVTSNGNSYFQSLLQLSE